MNLLVGVRELLRLKQLAMNGWVKLLWGPGHTEIKGNKFADELARKGAEKTPVGPVPIVRVVQQHVKAWISGNDFLEYTRR